jgi:4-hydroxy-2-oxoheptanedioate aldolase
MRPNLLKQRWAEGGAALNGWLMLPSPFVAELMAHQGFDSLTIDMQHGLMGYETMVAMLQAISTTDVTPVVRVPWNDPSLLMRAADAGAYAIICPMINSRTECEAFVGALRFPPAGYRSYGPVRARVYGGGDYVEHADSLVATIAMIETAEALDAVDDIASTPGLDALYVGPADLSISLGGSQRTDYTDPYLLSQLERIVGAGRRNGIAVGLHNATAEYAARAVDMGFQFVTLASDTGLLEAGAATSVRAYRAARAADTSDASAPSPLPY